MTERPEDEVVARTTEELDRAEDSDDATRLETLDETHRSLEAELGSAESRDRSE